MTVLSVVRAPVQVVEGSIYKGPLKVEWHVIPLCIDLNFSDFLCTRSCFLEYDQPPGQAWLWLCPVKDIRIHALNIR